MHPLERLREYLATSYSPEELRRLFDRYDRALSAELPSGPASFADVMHSALGLLQRHGVGPRFFDLLRADRPRRAAEVDELEAQRLGARVPDARRARAPRWYPYVRTGSDRFVGREHELERLHAMLTDGRLVGITAQIRGLGGIGKSLLAIEYARRFGDSWPGGIFWSEADPAWATRSQTADERLARRHAVLAGFAASLGVAAVPGNLAATARAVERALEAATAGERYLWIVDDLPAGVDQATLECLLPASPAGALLVTSRWMALDALPNRLDLGVLELEAALALLTCRRPPTDPHERSEAHALAVDVGCHPLALDVLGALVRDELSLTPYAHWRAVLAAPGNEFDRLGDALLDELPTGKERAITRVLASSLTRLNSAHSPLVLRIAAGLADAPIPGDLLVEVGAPLRAAPNELGQAVNELAAHALVTRVAEVAGIHVHAMVRWVARRWPATGPDNAAIDAACCDALCTRFEAADDLRRHDALLALLPHAEHASQGDSFEAVAVGGNLGHFAELRGDYHAARRHAERALRYYEGRLVPVNPHSAVAKHNLAVALKLLGDSANAERWFGEALVDYERLFGREHRRTMLALHGLATTFEGSGDFAAARRVYADLHDLQRRTLGPTDPDTLRTLTHLGGILSDLGDYAGSRILLEPALPVCEATLGPDHPITLDLQSFLAVTLKQQGHLADARALEERLLAARRQTLGAEHPSTLLCAQQLVRTMLQQDEFAAAADLGAQTLAVQLRVFGPEHPLTLETEHDLAVAQIEQGDLDGALARMERTLAAQSRVLGPEHPHRRITQEDLAWICLLRRDLPRARALLEEVVASRERLLAPDCVSIHQARFKLAETLLALGDTSAARAQIAALQPLRRRPTDQLSPRERFILERLERLERAASDRSAPDRRSETWVLLDVRVHHRPHWKP